MESDPLVHAWEMYWSHRLHGTTNDYKAFEDTVRPLLQQVEGERDALAADLAACQASNARLRVVAREARKILPSYSLRSIGEQDVADALFECGRNGDLREPDEIVETESTDA